MAIPFLQPEEDDSARHGNGANGAQPGGAGNSSSVGGGASVGNHIAGAAASGSVAVVVAGATGPLPIPNSPAPSGTSTAVQTPLIGPMNGDQLVQLFYEALYRYSRGDTPSTPISQSPQSSSCSPFTTGYYNGAGGGGGQVFFPQTPNGVYRPGGAGVGSRGAVFFGLPTPSPSGSSSHSSQHSANSPDTPSCSSATPIFHQFPSSFQMPSTPTTSNASTTTTPGNWNGEGDGDESSESDSSQQSSVSESSGATGCSPHCLGLSASHLHLHHLHRCDGVGGSSGTGSNSSNTVAAGTMGPLPANFIPPHLDYMAGREQLQEFAGKIPQRKKKSSKTSKSKKSRFLEQTLVWPTLAVTATLIALGCGLLAAR
ncbi:uncharacterized protein LOC135708798 [Ochlerotatus camptorhynchus]|uniref:uncharacterized protein LOC135708798 n=1 Tax=Ochlerotatus camptorhynchus TaxID=644619 RepID=UPI0031CFE459